MSNPLDPEGVTDAYIPVSIPNSQLQDFIDGLTGNDDDIILAAEKAIRALLPEPAVAFDGNVELEAPVVIFADGSRVPLGWLL